MADEEKLNVMLKGVWDRLTNEQKEKAKACKSADELIKLAASEGIELPDELLDSIAGGSIYPAENGGWWIINDLAGKVQTIDYGSKEQVQFTARRMGFSDRELTKKEFDKLGC